MGNSGYNGDILTFEVTGTQSQLDAVAAHEGVEVILWV